MNKARRNILPEKLDAMSEVLKTISHPVRLEVLEHLEGGNRYCVSELQEKTGIEQSLLSHHLTKMKDKGILKSHREGKNIYYTIGLDNITTIFDCMENCNII